MVYLRRPRSSCRTRCGVTAPPARHRPSPSAREELIVVYFCEQPPDPESRVLLSERRDRLGLTGCPRLARPGGGTGAFPAAGAARAQLERCGAGTLVPAGRARYTDASHHMGTTRMSASPALGVVDTDCRVHGMANLYVAGSSVSRTWATNPTLTLLALTLRLAEHLTAVNSARCPGARDRAR